MARYRVSVTVYKYPTGKTMVGPTALAFLGDICGAAGLLGAGFAIESAVKHYGVGPIVGCILVGIAGFGLMALIHKRAKKSAEAKYLQALEQQKGQKAEPWD
ncbi:MAG: hypothetical protein HDT35_00130 [Clostridiales bacterium]|nr:hypothetical protein [Clostridiales bacterium]